MDVTVYVTSMTSYKIGHDVDRVPRLFGKLTIWRYMWATPILLHFTTLRRRDRGGSEVFLAGEIFVGCVYSSYEIGHDVDRVAHLAKWANRDTLRQIKFFA